MQRLSWWSLFAIVGGAYWAYLIGLTCHGHEQVVWTSWICGGWVTLAAFTIYVDLTIKKAQA
jgi:hypothetical protein